MKKLKEDKYSILKRLGLNRLTTSTLAISPFLFVDHSSFDIFAQVKPFSSILTNNMTNTALNFANLFLGTIAGQASEAQSFSVQKDSLLTSLFVVAGVLVVIAILLAFIAANLANIIRLREGGEEAKEQSMWDATLRILKNRYTIITGNLILVIIVTILGVKQARSVGLHQGYKPEQPIKYSHALHAGKYQIDCQYCHTGAGKGKYAWIPSTNVCMNCHKVIKKGPKYGEKEIAKIYKAVGWDPDKKQYTGETEPVEWVRIHNLPDHAYFNHAQHVVAGQVACQTCHGPIQEMEVVYQYSPLSMGWCINCHRETEVNSQLYDKYYTDEEARKKVKYVEDIGGLNCSRCHY